MQVLFDYQIFNLQRFGGISRYFVALAEALNKIENTKATILSPYHDNEYLWDNDGNYVKTWGPIARKVFSNRFINRVEQVNQNVTQRYLAKHKTTVLHETYYTHRTVCKNPKVITVHDMIDEIFFDGNPEIETIIKKKKQALYEASQIIAISEHTKHDLIKYYPETANKITVIYHGVSPLAANVLPFQTARPYILFVGLRKKYKNFDNLLKAYASDPELQSAYDVLCFGGGDEQNNERDLIHQLKIAGKVIFMKGSDALLGSVYKGASVLAYVSLYEGFGMPVLEAMQAECPVLCAQSSSLPEVAGNAALFCKGEIIEDLHKNLKKILLDPELRATLKALGIARAKEFTWDRCAAQTKTVYELCTLSR